MADQEKKIEEVTEAAAETAEETKEAATEEEAKVEEKAEEKKAEEKVEEKLAKMKALEKEAAKPEGGKKLSGGLIAGICGGAVALIAIVLVVIAFISGSGAVSKYKAKDYDGAYKASRMAWFMAKSDKDLVTIGYVGNVLCEEGEYLKGAKLLKGVDQEANKKVLSDLYKAHPFLGMGIPGAIVEFMSYDQDGDNSALEPIEWIVLTVDESSDTPKALLLSKKVIGSIDSRSKKDGNTSYANSNIHEWCESSFYNDIIMGVDKKITDCILNVTVHTEPSSTGVDSGEDVKAHVFAPSLQDIEQYLQNDEAMAEYIRAEGTAAAKINKTKVTNKGYAGYWLRNAGESEGFASAVTDKGEIVEGSSMSSSHGIRPMMWIKLGQ